MLDHECRDVLLREFDSLGINIITNANITSVEQDNEQIKVNCGSKTYQGSHLLVAAGRQPNIEKLNLQAIDINHSSRGIKVDNRLRTNFKNIYAIGDVAGGHQFTHVAGYHAGVVIQNILFKLPVKVDYSSLAWSIYITPEVAHVGQSISQAEQDGAKIMSISYKDNDRAQASLSTIGIIKVAIDKKGYILGAAIVGKVLVSSLFNGLWLSKTNSK